MSDIQRLAVALANRYRLDREVGTGGMATVYLAHDVRHARNVGPVGGAVQPVNRQLFSGVPAIGEEYRHGLAHLILAPLVAGRTSYLVSEGRRLLVRVALPQFFQRAPLNDRYG